MQLQNWIEYRGNSFTKIYIKCVFVILLKTRDTFPAVKIYKKWFWKVFNVSTKSHFSNFEAGWWTFPWSRKLSLGLLGPSKLRNRLFLEKCLKWNLNFQNWSNSLCLGVSELTKWLVAQSTAYALCNCEGEKSKSVKYLRYMGDFFSRLMTSHYLKAASHYIIAKYKTSNCCKMKAVIQRCSVKKMFLKILENSQK